MSLQFGNYQNDVSSLLSKLSNYLNTSIPSLDHLRSGIILSKLLASHLKREKLNGIIYSQNQEHWQSNWDIILTHSENFLPSHLKTITSSQIISDSGLLFTISNLIFIKITHNKNSLSQYTEKTQKSSHFLSKSQTSKTLSYEKKTLTNIILDDMKCQIHKWLIESQAIPQNFYLHEFIYRMRTGVSLSELINCLEKKTEVISGIYKNPKSISYCIANINKSLEFLRKIPNIDSKYLWSSAEINAGLEEHIYGLLQDIKDYYEKKYVYKHRERTSSVKKIRRNKSMETFFITINVTSAMKRTIIQWVKSLGLENFIIFHDDFNINSIYNGVLLCETVGEIFKQKPRYISKPITDDQCLININSALLIIKNNISSKDKIPEKILEPNEETVWFVLWELMNNYKDYINNTIISKKKTLEDYIIDWIKSMNLLPIKVTKILELMPGIKNGTLLGQIVKNIIPSKKLEIIYTPQTENTGNINIRRIMTVLRNETKMPQKYIWKEKEIKLGDLKIVSGLLEDLYKFAKKNCIKGKKTNGEFYNNGFINDRDKEDNVDEVMINKNVNKVKEIENWLDEIGIKHNGLKGEVINEFKSGAKFWEIIETLENRRFDQVNPDPKSSSEAFANIRGILEFLCEKPNFDSKYLYLDDQVLAGSGKVIRSLLLLIKNIYSPKNLL
ncbi:hypothetical protein SteCoe_30675 [Stentor coeruleus]|uniref:Calponin-homology (CH) domain-containing protein n=1 Tax=Stentor coeruleus TaxID=5963 RepID=A0A1R2B337_9CILI|nr:hypothetical protein SteCoe_30675 [Stentor coeruleus]